LSIFKRFFDKHSNSNGTTGQTSNGTTDQTIATDSVCHADPKQVGMLDASFSGWYKGETGELLEGFGISAEDTVLDVGCGAGLATLFAASRGAHVVFSDVEEYKVNSLIERAERSKARKVEGFVSDSLPLPLPDHYANKIMSMEMLEHTAEPSKILDELYRVGQPGAQYLITVPGQASEMLQKPFAHPSYFTEPNHIQIFSETEFRNLVEGSGLVIEKFVPWGFYWTMWMSIFWSVPSNGAEGETLGVVNPPYHPALQKWADLWEELLKFPSAAGMVRAFNEALPKATAILARKPEH